MVFIKNNSKKSLISPFFIISILIIASLLVVIPLITIYILTQEYDKQIRNETHNVSVSIQQTVHSFINGAYNLCYELSLNSDTIDAPSNGNNIGISPILASTVRRNNFLELIYVTNAMRDSPVHRYGWQVSRSDGTLGDRSGRWWFLQIMETRQPFVGRSYISIATGMPCTAVFIPMYDDAGVMTHVFGADISLTYMQELVNQFSNASSGMFSFIIDGEGVVIAHPNNKYIKTLTNYKTLISTSPVIDEFGNALMGLDGNVITEDESFIISDSFMNVISAVMDGKSGLEIAEYNDTTYYMSYEPIALPGFSDSWSVVTLQDRDVAMSVVSRLFIQVTLIIIIVLIVFVILFFSFQNRLAAESSMLRSMEETAKKASKAKSDFLAMMSHEIRTPLNVIMGIAQVQLEDTSLPGKYAAAQEKIFSSGKNLLGIINDILDMSKIETGRLDFHIIEYDIPSLINNTVQLNIVRIGSKPIEFKLDVDKNLPSKLLGDELRLKQILNNLLSNAIKYTEKGYVKLTVRHVCEEEKIYLNFIVEDTGQGMKSEDKERLFTEYLRFNTEANRNTEGTGLGLNITQKLVEMMNGTISVQSEWGKGSIFTVIVQQEINRLPADKLPASTTDSTLEYIPIGQEAADRLENFTFTGECESEKQQIIREPMPYGSVLVVDDVHTNLFVAEDFLKPYQLNVETANSGFLAIEKVKSLMDSGAKGYDIIFMDHMMPKMDGIETTQKLRELGYTGSIIALTANVLTGNEKIFEQKGFDGFAPKPIDIRLLNTILNRFIRDKYPQEANKYKSEIVQLTDASN